MKVIILAAGYATRLYPLTLSNPKPLLKVGGRSIIGYLIEEFETIANISEVIVITNEKFHKNFIEWAESFKPSALPFSLRILNDGSTDDSNKLGAIGDISFAIEKLALDDDLMIVAGDNILDSGFSGFGEMCNKLSNPILGVYDVKNTEDAKKFSTVFLDDEGVITSFEEKPENPKSTLIGIALYFYPRKVLPLIRQYIKEGNNPDQPGRFVQWLYKRLPVYTWVVKGKWFDIGSKETLEVADKYLRTSH